MAVKSRVVLPYLVPKVWFGINLNFVGVLISSCFKRSLHWCSKTGSKISNSAQVTCRSTRCNLDYMMYPWLRIVHACVLCEVPSEKPYWSKILLLLLFPLANFSSCKHQSASIPLICGRRGPDTASGCNPTCYDVCAEREVGQCWWATGKWHSSFFGK